MVDLDKQFAAMADVSEKDTAYDFVIDEDLRVIAVPERGVVLGVEGDKDVNRVRFHMNRHYRGTDLSGFNIRINYRPAEGEINYFPVTEKTVQDESICFVWLVGADTVATKGTVYFVARFFTSAEDGTIEQEFNTTLGNASTLEGMVVDTQAEDKPVKDLLAQLEYDLKTYVAPFMQQAKSYADNSAQSALSSAVSANQAATYAGAAGTSAQNAQASADIAEAAQKKAQELANEIGAKVSTDTSLSVKGAPADAEATGNALNARYTKEEADQKFVTPTTMPVGTAETLGGVKLSEDFTADEDGTLHLAGGSCPFEVGDFIHTTSSVSPAARWGGSWEKIASERALMGASSTHAAGTTVEAGLPNITGKMPGIGRMSWTDFNFSGAFQKGDDINYDDTGDHNRFWLNYFNFDASKSNAIYGRSTTVQPAAYYVHIWHRVA